MSKIEELAKICKASVHIEANPQTTNYESIDDYVRIRDVTVVGDIDYEKTFWDVQAYPITPIGFVAACGSNLDDVLDEIIRAAKEY